MLSLTFIDIHFRILNIFPTFNQIRFVFRAFAACEIRTPTPTTPASTSSSSNAEGSTSDYSNRPAIASNTPEVDRVHDMLLDPQCVAQPQAKSPSPLREDIPSPSAQFLAFTSVDLPLCQRGRQASAVMQPYRALASAQRRLEFRQSSMQSKSGSNKRGLSRTEPSSPLTLHNVRPDDGDDADEEWSDSNTVVSSSRNAAGNAFREKRQSDPQIRYAFCNRGFEEYARPRRHSMWHHGDSSCRPVATMPDINEYSFEEDFDAYRTKEWPVNSLTAPNADEVVPVPRLKIRVCVERGQLMDMASFESTSSGEYSDSYCEVTERMSVDGDETGWFEESYYSGHSVFADPFAGGRCRDQCNASKCAKCGHKCLVRQFTNSFDA